MELYVLIILVSSLLVLIVIMDYDIVEQYIAIKINNDAKTDDKYKNICTDLHETIDVNNYDDIMVTTNSNTPILFKVKNCISKNAFTKALGNYYLDWAKDGISNIPIGKIKYKDFLKEVENNNTDKYLFDINREYTPQVNAIKNLIAFPDLFFIKDYPKVVIYTGTKDTGTNLHRHDYSLNYLIEGKKLWIIFPEGTNNDAYLSKNNYYDYCKKHKTIDWFSKEYVNLKQNLQDLCIFIQRSGETVYVPYGQHHAAINLENSYGFTYNGDYI